MREASREELLERLEKLEAENEVLSTKLTRTVSAAYHALLEESAWMGIPDKKREDFIENAMSNVRFCAEHDLRHVDESQRNRDLAAERDDAKRELAECKDELKKLIQDSECGDCIEIGNRMEATFTAKLAAYEATLKFYADTKNWDVVNGVCHDMVPKGLDRKLWQVMDMGERARKTLAGSPTGTEPAISNIRQD